MHVQEIGSQNVTVFERDSTDCKLATIVLRGSTTSYMDDIERAFDDAISTFKSTIKDQRFAPGAGATEIVFIIIDDSIWPKSWNKKDRN